MLVFYAGFDSETLPTAEERAEMRALDAKLDAIAAKLKA
jgi:hypothetical protein